MDGKKAARKAHLDFVKNWRSRPSESSIESSVDLSVDMEQQQHDDAAGAVGGAPLQLGPQLQPRMSQEQLDQVEIQRLQEKLASADNDTGRIAAIFHTHVRKNLNIDRSESVLATQQISERMERLETGLGGMEGNINRLTNELQRVIGALGQQQQPQQQQQQQQLPEPGCTCKPGTNLLSCLPRRPHTVRIIKFTAIF